MVRLLALELNNFRNVDFGRIVFSTIEDAQKKNNPSITGIYGQNGSGKTSIITALDILKRLISGMGLTDKDVDHVAVGKDAFSIQAEFYIEEKTSKKKKRECIVIYKVEVAINEGEPFVIEESLAYRNLIKKESLRTIFKLRNDDGRDRENAGDRDAAKTKNPTKGRGDKNVPAPTTMWKSLLSKGDVALQLRLASAISRVHHTSIVFSKEFGELLAELVELLVGNTAPSKAFLNALNAITIPLMEFYYSLRIFALQDLAIINLPHHATTSLNFVNVVSHEGNTYSPAGRVLQIDISNPQPVSQKTMEAIKHTLESTNEVLGALVPGLSLSVKDLGPVVLDNGEEGNRIDILATRGDITVPFRCESEGIKKIVTILVSLIDVYSSPDACVAIDELDSGVFEFLLGEILEVISEHGKGQLIFTAHNLRPLETLPVGALIFTTTNPNNRYIPFKGHKKTNNMRDQYLRAINVGGQTELIYEPTSKYEIDDAFYEAGVTMAEAFPSGSGEASSSEVSSSETGSGEASSSEVSHSESSSGGLDSSE